ncbi:unnamed protein product [Calypogeia fissa]
MASVMDSGDGGREGSEGVDGNGSGIGSGETMGADGNAEEGIRRRARIEHKEAKGWPGKLKASMWHGGTWVDAWFSALAGQIGSVLLVFPYTLAQMGYGWGLSLQVVYAIYGCWTVYLLSWMYNEMSARKTTREKFDDRHILQYHEVIGGLAGKWAGRITKAFNITGLTFGCVLQVIANGSDVYYLDTSWSKRTWTYVFGALTLLTILIPSMHNLRIISFTGVVAISFTGWYLTGAALQHGQVANVKHSGPTDKVQFFTGATNILFTFGAHGICMEIMEAMYQPRVYNYIYILAVIWTLCLSIPDSVSVYWAFGDVLLTNSNAYGVLPPSGARTTSIVLMIIHQYVAIILNINPVFLVAEKAVGLHTISNFFLKCLVRIPVVCLVWFLALAIPFFGPINSVFGAFLIAFSVYIIPCVAFIIAYRTKEARQNSVWKPSPYFYGWRGTFAISGFIAIWVFVLGFGFGGWASVTNLVQQIHLFGFFAKCYQCPPKK